MGEMARRLNELGIPPRQGAEWNKSTIYNLRLRLRQISPRPHNERPYTDDDLKARIVELRTRGHTQGQIAGILNQQGWIPLKGREFTERNVRAHRNRAE